MIEKIIRHKMAIIIVFAVTAVLCALMARSVKVNYDLLDYLPKDSASTVSLEKMEQVFGKIEDNGSRVMVPVKGVPEALEMKKRIAALDGVESVRWLDDSADVNQPLSFIDEDKLDKWYKDGYALFTVNFTNDVTGKQTAQTLVSVREVVGDESAISGGAVNTTAAKQSTGQELKTMMTILVPFVILVMLLATTSWFEPVLFIFVIGIAIVINMGTNALLGEISFVTQTAAAVLQLAVSMDYSIFLIHRFRDYRAEGLAPETAMKKAMKSAFPTVIASGVTTIFGFAALMLMRFLIGVDMGVVLAKGVIFSLLSVLFLLPVLTLLTYKLIEKTSHRSLLPKFSKLGRLVVRIGGPVIIVVALTLVPSFLAQQKSTFIFGTSAVSSSEQTQIGRDEKAINQIFGETSQMTLMVPDGDMAKERMLADDIQALPYVTDVTAYVTTIGTQIPKESVPEDTLSALQSGGYSRMVIAAETSSESDEAFATVEVVRTLAQQYYDESYLTGGSVNIYDMKQVVTADNPVVTVTAIAAIALVILLTFRSLTLPIFLVLAIEASIWINLAVPYFTGTPLVYIGYIIISSIQLGATVDYAILYSSRYMEKRLLLGKKEAAAEAVAETFGSILTSAGILAGAGFIISLVSTNAVIGQLGELISRGAVLSTLTVVFFLPGLLRLFDGVIRKTTWIRRHS